MWLMEKALLVRGALSSHLLFGNISMEEGGAEKREEEKRRQKHE